MKHTYWTFAKENLKVIWVFTGSMLVFIWSMYLFWNLPLVDALLISGIIKLVNLLGLLGARMSYKKKQQYDAFDGYEEDEEL
jgi:hypothetical protein